MTETAQSGAENSPDAVSDTSDDARTVRDRVWEVTLELLSERPIPFRLYRVRDRAGFDKSRDRTIRRTLSAMVAAGWLSHDSGSQWWHPGPKAREHLIEE